MINELLRNEHFIKGKTLDCKLSIPKEEIEILSKSKIKKSSSVSLLNNKNKKDKSLIIEI
jgi:hypothetical protein